MPKGDVETYHQDGAWHNRIEGVEVLSDHRTKEEAQAAGRRYAGGPEGRAHHQNENGQIAERNSYGHDRRNIRG